ncbi:hypothetical protein PUNSTDRAFT_141898 [Punctularia strigosozonata HHB-11173 SS5]|uniref:uncharacterized protein n=1 Tax=Punctularia strigosozonata (strain HHB-11173) TaxID=741275 RepID=UPI0004416910|nr:uncharacterized protein PUNSTDRAFT_141898 [Punctularia strigosozonata HHB-11173 SS5]EIN11571.1 hypothetical protein PUNSTDRAFT_141898 [Punctularia strigosozonata HHB-11173 SS5]
MPSLTDSLDRINKATNAIHDVVSGTSRPSRSAGWFARAVLETPTNLPDLIRDIDDSELGLFTLIPPDPVAGSNGTRPEITRMAHHAATPLRKQKSTVQAKAPNPEIFVEAAQRQLDRYDSIHPMPQAKAAVESLMERVHSVRDQIRRLSMELERSGDRTTDSDTDEDHRASDQSQYRREQHRVEELQGKIAEARARKEAFLDKRATSAGSKPKHPTPPVQAPNSKEAEFWNSPGIGERTRQFTGGLLMDESVDMNADDLTMSALASPTPMKPPARSFGSRSHAATPTRSAANPTNKNSGMGIGADPSTPMEAVTLETGEPEGDLGDVPEDDKTVVLPKPPAAASLNSPTSPSAPDDPGHTREPTAPPTPTPLSKTLIERGIKVTPGIERIVEKIWSTVGEIISPGQQYDGSGAAAAKPQAKDTIRHLEIVSTQMPAPGSPGPSTASSFSGVEAAEGGAPTSQQVLLAHLLLALLNSPTHSMPLNSIKELMADKATGIGSDDGLGLGIGGGAMKAYYTCVAKRLLKVDRSSREQVVKFNAL